MVAAPWFTIWTCMFRRGVYMVCLLYTSLLLAGALKENNVPFELHLFTHGGHGSSTCTNEVNTPNKHNNAWLPLSMGWLGEENGKLENKLKTVGKSKKSPQPTGNWLRGN